MCAFVEDGERSVGGMFVSIASFEPESFVFPRVSRVDEKTAQLYVISEGGREVPAVSASREMLNVAWCESARFEVVSRGLALLLLACRVEDVADNNRSCPETTGLFEKIDSVQKRFTRWIESAKLCFDGVLPCTVDETSEAECDFRREMCLMVSQLIRSDVGRVRRLRRCSIPEIRVKVSEPQLESIMRQLVGVSVNQYDRFRAHFDERVRSVEFANPLRSDRALLLRSEVDAVLRAALCFGARNERLRNIGQISGMSLELLRCFPAWSTIERQLRNATAECVPPDLKKHMISELNEAIKRYRLRRFRHLVIDVYRERCVTQEVALLASLYYCQKVVSSKSERALYDRTGSGLAPGSRA
ncbi:hypothetical protein CYMTET_3900 [Cymbomonas tetramitiformis]|uniref:Uncharacterized protein n=1 Tax=Cymbomonas tetramitiformis TaxID=36881 RepID=A0AAE0H2B0_9CHLO|nr:hypothetical protein CYMTET_3900 [Cymbomonas tetramitiformis]|eukprot:gene29943-37377_t